MCFIDRFSFALAFLALTTGATIAAPVAQVIKLSGHVEVSRGDDIGTLEIGAALEPGDRLRSDKTGRVRLQLVDGSVINLGSNSELTLADIVSAGPGTERQIELELAEGAVRALAAPATPNSRFEIRTPLAVTAVRGTEWGILSNTLQSDVIIFSGRVGIRRNIISGESAISLTRSLGTTVTATGLGPVGRWSPEQLAAFEAATSVPGDEIPFNLETAPATILVPIQAPTETPIGTPTEEPSSQSTKRCRDQDGLNCRRGGRSRDRDHEPNGSRDGHDTGGNSS